MKRISVMFVALVASLLALVTLVVTPSAHAGTVTHGCTAELSPEPPAIKFKNSSGKELGFGGLKVIKAANSNNIYCVKFSTGGRTVQRAFTYLHYRLNADGSCPVPGGFGGGDFPWGRGHNKQLSVDPGTCTRAYYVIKYGGDYYRASFMRKYV